MSGTWAGKTNSWYFSGISLHLYVFSPARWTQKSQTSYTAVHGQESRVYPNREPGGGHFTFTEQASKSSSILFSHGSNPSQRPTQIQGEGPGPTSTMSQRGHKESRILPSSCSIDLALSSANSPMVTKWLLQIQFKQTQQHPTEEEMVLISYLFCPQYFY